mmetsp:Transcript_49444/g.127559  ORF Transcript_49444/g.127559 Transcript_49444/m.127559 type:complete len:289 (+) Transcript_49444:460-1326(+)
MQHRVPRVRELGVDHVQVPQRDGGERKDRHEVAARNDALNEVEGQDDEQDGVRQVACQGHHDSRGLDDVVLVVRVVVEPRTVVLAEVDDPHHEVEHEEVGHQDQGLDRRRQIFDREGHDVEDVGDGPQEDDEARPGDDGRDALGPGQRLPPAVPVLLLGHVLRERAHPGDVLVVRAREVVEVGDAAEDVGGKNGHEAKHTELPGEHGRQRWQCAFIAELAVNAVESHARGIDGREGGTQAAPDLRGQRAVHGADGGGRVRERAAGAVRMREMAGSNPGEPTSGRLEPP